MEGEERWGIVGNNGGEMSWGSFRIGAGILVYQDRQMKTEERWGIIGERWRELGKG